MRDSDWNILDKYRVEGGFSYTFYEDDSDFDGNDFSYTYYFDLGNTEKLRALMFADGRYTDMRAWVKDSVRDKEFGSDFRAFCVAHGIHGARWTREDYPGGISSVTEF